jgi:polyferredoxin
MTDRVADSRGGGDERARGAGPRGGAGIARFLRATSVRIVCQAVCGLLFLYLFGVTWLSRLGGYPVSLFLEIDPLVSIATALSTGTVYRSLAWSLWVLVPTLFLGRVFCGWVCPLGSLHHLFGWLFNARRFGENVAVNRWRPLYRLKYVLLTALLVMAAFGVLQIGWLDPIALAIRSLTAALAPAWDAAVAAGGESLAARGQAADWLAALVCKPGGEALRVHAGAWAIGLVLATVVGLNLVLPRFFCRALCPLGALLGVLSRFALWRIDREPRLCTDCDACLRSCPGACDPQAALRKSECFVCFNCVDDCPEGALAFRFLPAARPAAAPATAAAPGPAAAAPAPRAAPADARGVGSRGAPSRVPAGEIVGPDLGRRRLLFAGLAGALAAPFLRLSPAVDDRSFSPAAIRPPGSVAESEFLERCIKCDQCVSVCPTNVLQPATLHEAGLEGVWTPVLNMRVGYCQLDCLLCGEVCPTGAIAPLSIARKRGLGPHAADGPVKIGTAFFDRGRCLPWGLETPCIVCQEVCPVSPKAIGTYDERVRRWDGTIVTLQKPFLRAELCTGCGVCEYACPVAGGPAVYVQAVGETRSRARSLLLRSAPGAST